VSSDRPVTIIAEAAQGFEGNVTLARLLVKAAKAGNADIVKFQLVLADELATRDYAYYGLFKQLEMPLADWRAVADDAEKAGLGLAFDIFGPESLRLAIELGARAVKLHSTDFFNGKLVAAAQRAAPRLLFSVGGIEADEIAAFVERAHPDARAKLTMMYGFQAEPTLTGDNNLARLASLRQRLPNLDLGFMDHADGTGDDAGWLGVLALPYGVSTLEKHITLDRSIELEDYISALSPSEFATYVKRVRLAEAALGSACLDLSEPERAYRGRAVKVVVAAKTLAPGTVINDDVVSLLRAPKEGQRTSFQTLDGVLGRTVAREIAAGTPVNAEDLS
jgi:N,N'-diacetyllegionaminate synthase